MNEFPARNPEFRRAVADYVAAQGYLGLLGVELASVSPGRVEYQVRFRAELGQQDGVFHGGVVGGIAEAVMGAAAFSLVEAGANVVGAEYKCNLVASASGSLLVARGLVIRAGGRLIVCRADILSRDDAGGETLAAIAQGTMAVIRPR